MAIAPALARPSAIDLPVPQRECQQVRGPDRARSGEQVRPFDLSSLEKLSDEEDRARPDGDGDRREPDEGKSASPVMLLTQAGDRQRDGQDGGHGQGHPWWSEGQLAGDKGEQPADREERQGRRPAWHPTRRQPRRRDRH